MILTGFVSSGVRLQALSDDMLFSEWERELKKRREEKKTEDYCCTTAAAHVDITRRDGTRVYCSRTADADTSRSVWCLTRCSTSAYSPAAARQKQPMVQARRRVVAFRSGPGRCYIAPPRRRRAVGPRARARARTHTHTHTNARARAQRHARTRTAPRQRRHRPATHAAPKSFYNSIYRRAGSRAGQRV